MSLRQLRERVYGRPATNNRSSRRELSFLVCCYRVERCPWKDIPAATSKNCCSDEPVCSLAALRCERARRLAARGRERGSAATHSIGGFTRDCSLSRPECGNISQPLRSESSAVCSLRTLDAVRSLAPLTPTPALALFPPAVLLGKRRAAPHPPTPMTRAKS